MKKNEKRSAPKNPNKRDCVAKNITFSVQRENEYWLRLLSKKLIPSSELAEWIKRHESGEEQGRIDYTEGLIEDVKNHLEELKNSDRRH